LRSIWKSSGALRQTLIHAASSPLLSPGAAVCCGFEGDTDAIEGRLVHDHVSHCTVCNTSRASNEQRGRSRFTPRLVSSIGGSRLTNPRQYFVLLGIGLCLAIAGKCANGQAPDNSSQLNASHAAASLMDQPADVVIFVKPLSDETASIGVAYSTRIPHDHVKDDLRRLLSQTNWAYRGDLMINDASVHPERLKEFPVTTGAQLTVTHAAQVRKGVPALLPYLQAFQAFSHVEVNFALPDLVPYNGVDHFDSKALKVELHKDQGVYRYETEILDHQNPLPELVKTADATTAPSDVREAMAHASTPRSGRTGGVLIVLGSIIVVGCIGIFALLSRRDTRALPARTTLRR
jgi:hypothetical protein